MQLIENETFVRRTEDRFVVGDCRDDRWRNPYPFLDGAASAPWGGGGGGGGSYDNSATIF